MILIFLKLSLRLLVRNPFFTLINVIGLALGFTSFFALWQYSTSELKPHTVGNLNGDYVHRNSLIAPEGCDYKSSRITTLSIINL